LFPETEEKKPNYFYSYIRLQLLLIYLSDKHYARHRHGQPNRFHFCGFRHVAETNVTRVPIGCWNESRHPIGYLGLGGKVAALSDFVLAGIQIQPFVLQNLAIYII
jgi:hypothetical protein